MSRSGGASCSRARRSTSASSRSSPRSTTSTTRPIGALDAGHARGRGRRALRARPRAPARRRGGDHGRRRLAGPRARRQAAAAPVRAGDREPRSRVFSASLFAENEAMLTLFERLGEVTVARRDGPVLEIDVELPRRAPDARAHAARGRGRARGAPAAMSTGFGLDHLPYGVVDGRCVVRYEDHVLDLSTVPGLPPVFDRPSLNRFLALGRPAWEDVREQVTRVLEAGTAELDAIDEPRAAGRGRRLRRLLLVARARDDRRAAVPARRRPAAARLARAADRLPRARGLDRRLGHRHRPPARTAAGVRADRGARLRARAGLRHRARQAPRLPDRGGRRPRPRLRLRARQRLERARPAALRVPAARAVPGQVVRDLDLGLGHAAGRAGAVPGARRASRIPSPPSTCGRTATGRSTSTLEVELNGEVDHPRQRAQPLLDVPAAARARDRQRRRRAPRRPVRVGDDLAASSRARRAACSSPGAGFLADGDTVDPARARGHDRARRGARDDRQRPVIAATAEGRG